MLTINPVRPPPMVEPVNPNKPQRSGPGRDAVEPSTLPPRPAARLASGATLAAILDMAGENSGTPENPRPANRER